ncbi:MAG: LptF/LptG family permease [Trueperaceae bacterium]
MPSRLARYVLRETAAMYVLGVAAFCLLLSIDFLALWAEYLIEQEATLATVVRLMAFKLPWFLHLSLPVAVVVAVLLATGRLARDSELKAAYGLGIKPLTLLAPVMLFGLLVSGVSLLNNGYLEPEGERRYNRLVDSFFYTRPPNEVQSNAAYALPAGGIYYASRIRARPDSSSTAELSGVLVILPDGTVLSAPAGVWNSQERQWLLQEVERSRPNGEPQLLGELELPFELDSAAGETLTRREALSLPALSQQIRAVQGAGGNTRELRFSLHRRIADAFSALVFALFAGTLGLGLRNRSAGFTWSIVLLVAFWATWTLAGNLFETGVLGAAVAAWLTTAVVGLCGSLVALWRLRS